MFTTKTTTWRLLGAFGLIAVLTIGGASAATAAKKTVRTEKKSTKTVRHSNGKGYEETTRTEETTTWTEESDGPTSAETSPAPNGGTTTKCLTFGGGLALRAGPGSCPSYTVGGQ